MNKKAKGYLLVLAVVVGAGVAESVYNAVTYDDFRYNAVKKAIAANSKIQLLCGESLSVSTLPSSTVYLYSVLFYTTATGRKAQLYVKAKLLKHGSSWRITYLKTRTRISEEWQ